jgi:glycosyltransferase involved in cell wall biosynthesis
VPRVLVVAYFFPPLGGAGVHRPVAWSRFLPEHGWDVTVLASAPGGYFVDDATMLGTVPEATEVIRVAAPTAVALWRRHLGPPRPPRPAAVGPDGTLRRATHAGLIRRDNLLRAVARFAFLPDSYRAWVGPAIRAGRARIARGDIDAVISTSPPESCHLVGEALATRDGARVLPWIADFRDPWVALHYRTPPTPLHARAHRRMERRVLEHADRVLCASRTHLRAVEDVLGREDAAARLRFMPNGAETDRPGPLAGPHGGNRIVFTGTLVETPAMLRFLEALARRLAAEPRRRGRFTLEIAGPYGEEYEARVRELGLGDVVRFIGPVSFAEGRALQQGADVLLLVRNEGKGYEAMVPGKLYAYLAARRPIVAMVGTSEASGIARQGGAAVTTPNDGDAAVSAALAVLDGAPGAARPNEAAIEELLRARSRETLAGTLAGILDEVVRPARPASASR